MIAHYVISPEAVNFDLSGVVYKKVRRSMLPVLTLLQSGTFSSKIPLHRQGRQYDQLLDKGRIIKMMEEGLSAWQVAS